MDSLNEEKITVSIVLYGAHAKKLLEACKRSRRSRRCEVTMRIEDHLESQKDLIVTTSNKNNIM